MKNFKKVLALVLAFAMVLSSMTISFAAEATLYATQPEAEALYDLDLFQGKSTTDKVLDLEGELTREMAMKLMADIFGWELDGDSEFTDVAAWAQPAVAAAVANGITDGIGDGKFGGQDQATGIQVVTWFLRALGYDQKEAYEKAAELGMEAGIITLEEALTLKDASLRGNLTKVAYNTLKATPVGEDVTVAEKLVEAGTIDEAKAEELGLVAPAVPEVLAVEEINVINLIQLEVVFNGEVDKDEAETEDNYSLTDVTEGEVAVANAELLEDGKTVILTLDIAADQQDVVDVTVEDVVEETTVEGIEFIDMTIPTVVDAEVVGNDTIKITFSEPVQAGNKDGFEVNEGKLYIKEVRLQNNNTEALVELYSDLKEGETTIEVNNSTLDYAGFGVVKETLTVSVVEDEEAPVVVGYEDATLNGVTLIWSEDIEEASKGAVKDSDDAIYYHTNSKNGAATVAVDGNKMTLTFVADTDDDGDLDVENPLPEGTAYVYVLKEAVNDLWDNKNAQEMIKVEVEIDLTAPEVEGDIDIKTEEQVVIEFTEELDSGLATDEDNYSLLDSEGKEVEDIFDGFAYVNADKKVTIDFTGKLSGDYTLVIEDLEDLAGNVIADTTIDFTVDDLTKPNAAEDKWTATLYNANDEGQMVKVDFKQKMATEGKYSVLDLEKYSINDKELADIDDVVITLVDNGEAVEIEIDAEKLELTEDMGTSVVIARVADAADNYTAKLSNEVALVDQSEVLIDSVIAISTTELKVTFKDELVEFEEDDLVITTADDIDDIDADKDSEDKNTFDIAGVSIALNDDGNTVATFTIDEDGEKFAHDVETTENNIYVFVVGADEDKDENPISESHNIYGETLLIGDNKSATDEVTPELAVLPADADKDYVVCTSGATVTIALTFEEKIDGNTVSTLTFEVEDSKVTGVKTDGKVVTLTITYDDSIEGAPVGTKITQKYAITDKKGNKVEDIKTEVADIIEE